jgi:CDP-diacylglycerol--serine O-phosphatidyltransferase
MARRALMVRVVRRRDNSPLTSEFGGAPTSTIHVTSETGLDVPRRRYRLRPGTRRTQTRRTPVEFAIPASPAPTGAAAVLPAVTTPPAAEDCDTPVPRTIPLLPGDKTLARRIKFGVANGCTIASLLLGLSAIFLSMHGDARTAAALLIGCVIFDGLDGALARKMGVASPFGAQMDSLADMCSFGLAAPVVVYASMQGEVPAAFIALACGMIAAGAAIRLARFNVSPKDGRFFCGVPTTMTAAVMGMAVLIGLHLPGPVAVVSVGLLAVAMVSGFPYAKVGRLARLPLWVWIAPAVGLLLDFQTTFALLVALYLISGPLLWLRQRGTVQVA